MKKAKTFIFIDELLILKSFGIFIPIYIGFFVSLHKIGSTSVIQVDLIAFGLHNLYKNLFFE